MNSEQKGVYVFYLLGKPPRSVGDTEADSLNSSPEKVSESTVNLPSNSNSSQSLIISRCACEKSRCVRLKCSCFNSQGFCGPHCGCLGCLNTPQFEKIRDLAISYNQKIFNNAFQTRLVVKVQGHEILATGCQCKRSLCETRYCACVKSGVGCSSLCCCKDCENSKLETPITENNFKLPQKNKRKRFRIIIKEQQECHNDSNFEELASLKPL